MTDDGVADDPIAALWLQVRPRQVAAAEELQRQLAAVAADPSDRAAWAAARAVGHKLAGTLGSYGAVRAGAAAVELEGLIGGVEEPAPSVSVVSRARELTAQVLTALAEET